MDRGVEVVESTLLVQDLYHTHLLWCLKHLLQAYDARVTECLEDGDLCTQLRLVLVGEPELVNHLHRHSLAVLAALTCDPTKN